MSEEGVSFTLAELCALTSELPTTSAPWNCEFGVGACPRARLQIAATALSVEVHPAHAPQFQLVCTCGNAAAACACTKSTWDAELLAYTRALAETVDMFNDAYGRSVCARISDARVHYDDTSSPVSVRLDMDVELLTVDAFGAGANTSALAVHACLQALQPGTFMLRGARMQYNSTLPWVRTNFGTVFASCCLPPLYLLLQRSLRNDDAFQCTLRGSGGKSFTLSGYGASFRLGCDARKRARLGVSGFSDADLAVLEVDCVIDDTDSPALNAAKLQICSDGCAM